MFRPGGSESESDDDGFDFGYDKPKDEIYNNKLNISKQFDEAFQSSDAEKIFQLWELNYKNCSIDTPLDNGLSLMMHSCVSGCVDIVRILIKRGADCNSRIGSYTPLMKACICQLPEPALLIVQILIENGAVINISDDKGYTPLMIAILNGHVEIVKILIKSACLESADAYGNTPVFLAIEKNNSEMLNLLINAGAKLDITNINGFKPREYAIYNGYEDIAQLLPLEEEEQIIPKNYLHYLKYTDLAPTAFETQTPAYFQEIPAMLYGMNMEKFTYNFAENKINLEEFLTITDEKLLAIGIKLPFHRKKIHLGLFRFHSHKWKKSSLTKVSHCEKEDTYDMYLIFASYLKHIIIMKSSLMYVANNEIFNNTGKINKKTLDSLLISLKEFQREVAIMKEYTKHLETFNPPPVRSINMDYFKEKKEKKSWLALLTKISFFGVLFLLLKKQKFSFFYALYDKFCLNYKLPLFFK